MSGKVQLGMSGRTDGEIKHVSIMMSVANSFRPYAHRASRLVLSEINR